MDIPSRRVTRKTQNNDTPYRKSIYNLQIYTIPISPNTYLLPFHPYSQEVLNKYSYNSAYSRCVRRINFTLQKTNKGNSAVAQRCDWNSELQTCLWIFSLPFLTVYCTHTQKRSDFHVEGVFDIQSRYSLKSNISFGIEETAMFYFPKLSSFFLGDFFASFLLDGLYRERFTRNSYVSVEDLWAYVVLSCHKRWKMIVFWFGNVI